MTQLTMTRTIFVGAFTLLAACGGKEFLAQESDFVGFTSWTKTAGPISGIGPNPSAIGPAHDSGDPTISRTIYIKDNATRGSDGQFPVGTILIKAHSKGGAMIGGTAMVKRGNSFNPSAKDWEWFMIAATGSIMVRGGAEVMDGACNSCHSGASNKDFVFTR